MADIKMTLIEKLTSLAECTIDFEEWNGWWNINARLIKEAVEIAEFNALNCRITSYGHNVYLVQCQKGAVKYLEKHSIPFQLSTLYREKANADRKKIQEDFEQEKIEWKECQRQKADKRDSEMPKLLALKLKPDFLQNSNLRTLPMSATDIDIIQLLMEWIEILSLERYEQAINMFLCSNLENDGKWTAQLLEQCVYGYGCWGVTREEAAREFGSSDYKITSLLNSDFKEEVLRDIDIDRFKGTERLTYCGTANQPANIIGDIHFNSIPLNNEPSYLTARFWIRKIDDNAFTLEFLDMHVM